MKHSREKNAHGRIILRQRWHSSVFQALPKKESPSSQAAPAAGKAIHIFSSFFGFLSNRLLAKIDAIRRADVVIAAAGMEGALGSVLAGLVESPLVAVPTSVGYGATGNQYRHQRRAHDAQYSLHLRAI